MCRYAKIDLNDCYLSGPTPLTKPDMKAKKHSRPRYDRKRYKVSPRQRSVEAVQ